MKTAKLLGLVAESQVKKADLNKLSGLIEPGRIVDTLDGSAYRVASKMVVANSFTFRLADLHGKPVQTPANFYPVSPALAHLAACMRFVFAFNKDFDLYVKAYIKEAGLPVDPKMNWAKWFQATYPAKLSGLTKNPEVVDEAIHQVIITALGHRKDLTKFDPSRLPEGARKQPLAEQVTTYLQWLFKKRVSEAYEFIHEKLEPYRETPMEQEGPESEGEETTYNILDTPEYATSGGQEEVAGESDLEDLRDQFAAYLQDEETPNEIKKLLVLYDFFTTHAGTAHKLKISDYGQSPRGGYWTEKTGLGFDSLKPVYAKFYGYMPEFLVAAGLIDPEKAKARGMHASSLNLASAEWDPETKSYSDANKCPSCQGSGVITPPEAAAPTTGQGAAKCPTCQGTGKTAGEVQLPDDTTYVGDNESVIATGPTSDNQIIPNIKVPGPEAGPSNDELHENSDALNGGSPTFDGDLKSPERANVNAIREAIETQAEMEVGKTIAEKEEEVVEGENAVNVPAKPQTPTAPPAPQVIVVPVPAPAATPAPVQTAPPAPTKQIVINLAGKTALNQGFCPKTSAADDMCNACGREVANRECAHGILCDGCDEQVHGAVGAPCEIEKQASLTKVAYVGKCPGHKNSEGESAPWCVFQHETGKILTSYKSEEAAKEGLKNMESHKHGATDSIGARENPGVHKEYCTKCKKETNHASKGDETQCMDCHTIVKGGKKYGGAAVPGSTADEVDRTGDKEVEFNEKRSADDTGRLPHQGPGGGAKTGPAGPTIIEQAPPEKKPEMPTPHTVPAELPNRDYRMQMQGAAKKYEAYGVKGMSSTPWRRQFNSHEEAEKWADEHNAEIQGWRETEESKTADEADHYDFPENWSKDNSEGPVEKVWQGERGLRLSMTLEQALSANHQGRCDDDVIALSKDPAISQQLEQLNPEDVRAELKAYGAWDDQELLSTEENLQRLLWIAAGDIKEDAEGIGQESEDTRHGRTSADQSPLPGEETKACPLCGGVREHEVWCFNRGIPLTAADVSSPNGLSEEEAEQILSQVQHGDRVTILVPAGIGREGQEWSKATGRAVMRNDYGWALNMGGTHGTPGVATTRNIVSVRKGKAGSKTVIAARNQDVWKRLEAAFPGMNRISFSNKTQEYIVKKGYFYTHGYDESRLEAAVLKAIPEAQITLVTNHWNAWPKDSWFEVRFKVPGPPKEERAKAMGLPSAVPGAAGVDSQGNIIPAQEQTEQAYHGAAAKKADTDPLLETTNENFDVAPDPLLESGPTMQDYGYAPSETKPQGDDTLRASNAEVLRKYDYTPFKDTEKAQYWKSPIGTTAILYPDGHWRHSAGDTVEGTRPEELADRLLKYHHKVVPKMGSSATSRN
jgi:hypothetical protein